MDLVADRTFLSAGEVVVQVPCMYCTDRRAPSFIVLGYVSCAYCITPIGAKMQAGVWLILHLQKRKPSRGNNLGKREMVVLREWKRG